MKYSKSALSLNKTQLKDKEEVINQHKDNKEEVINNKQEEVNHDIRKEQDIKLTGVTDAAPSNKKKKDPTTRSSTTTEEEEDVDCDTSKKKTEKQECRSHRHDAVSNID